MRSPLLTLHRRRGSILAIALVAIGFITISFSAWVGLLGQRGRAGEVEEHAARRRLAAWNSRSAIREYALQRMITSSGDNDGVNFDPSSGWSVTSAAAWAGYPMESNTRLAGLNAFSFTWDYPYSKVIDTTAGTKSLGYDLTGSDVNGNYRVTPAYGATSSYLKTYVRSRCPVLGGDLLIVHRSSIDPPVDPTVSGNITVAGRVLHFVPELAATAYTARSARFIAPPGASPMALRPKDLNGNDIPPSNLAWTPVTFGSVGGITDLTGKSNIIDDSTNGGNSLRQKLTASAATIQNAGGTAISDPRGFENNGNGLVTLTPCIGPTNPADLPSVIVDSEVQEIVIEGQTGANFDSYAQYRPAIAFVYVQRENSVRKLQTIRLRKQDRRRFILAIKQEGNSAGLPVNVIVEDTNATSEWNVVILAENTPLIFSAPPPVSTIRIAGGIQTNAPLAGPGAGQTLSLILQSDTRGLIKLTPRAAWVETIMPDKIPNSTNDNTW
jgi:hypothetical protein